MLGTIALFQPRKGTEVFIKALSILWSFGYDVRGRAVGPSESKRYGAKIKDRAKEHKVDDAIEWNSIHQRR